MIILPILVYLAAFSLAIIELVIAGEPSGNFFGARAASFGVPYYVLTSTCLPLSYNLASALTSHG